VVLLREDILKSSAFVGTGVVVLMACGGAVVGAGSEGGGSNGTGSGSGLGPGSSIGSGSSVGPGSSVGSGSSVGPGSSGSGSSFGGSPACQKLLSCCPPGVTRACLAIANAGVEAACVRAVSTECDTGSGSGSTVGSGSGADITCSDVSSSGSSTVCVFDNADIPGFSCTAPTTVGSCPSAGAVGCCVTTSHTDQYLVTAGACYYDATTASAAKSACTDMNEYWSTAVP
jgi:hypothetical protein